MDTFLYALLVVRMDPLMPERAAEFMVKLPKSKAGIKTFTPPDFIVDQVPIPYRVIRGVGDQPEAFFAL